MRKLGSQAPELELGQKFKQKVSVVLELSLLPNLLVVIPGIEHIEQELF